MRLFKNKSTFRQLVVMLGLLLIINFITILAVLRHLTIEPTAAQMAMFIDTQLTSIKEIIQHKKIDQAQLIVAKTFANKQVTVSQNPKGMAFPKLNFYAVLSQNLQKTQSLQFKLEETAEYSRIWIKPKWLDGYWLGIAFQPFINHVSQLLITVVIALLLLSLIAAYFFSRYMLSPFKQLAQVAADIVEQKVDIQQIPLTGTKEVQKISQLVKTSAQQMQRVTKEKEMLLAGVSHDLRTPLARMRLQAEFLSDDESRDTFVQEIEEMDAIIGDFITYVRSGNIEEFQQVSLTEIINETIEQFSQMKKSIQYKGNNKPLFIKIKPLSFKRMLSNILDNAFKYGEPPIEITVKEANQFIVLNIRDHGHGVSQQALKTLFEPFVMANNTENQYGSGLGLSIVKKLAQQNNIVVQAKNHSDGGLVISLQLHQ